MQARPFHPGKVLLHLQLEVRTILGAKSDRRAMPEYPTAISRSQHARAPAVTRCAGPRSGAPMSLCKCGLLERCATDPDAPILSQAGEGGFSIQLTPTIRNQI